MSLSSLTARNATISRRTQSGPPDRTNRPTWVVTVQTNVPAYIEQTETTEVTVGRETQIATHRIVFDAIVTLDGSDEVTIDNKAYQIVGPPWNVDRPPFGPHHTEALAREVTI